MSGIVFFKTTNINELTSFYTERVGMAIWLRQEDCIILRHGNMLLGFCTRDEIENMGMITFFFETRSEVDEMYDKLRDIATSKPIDNEKYNIYQFFAQDPEGRALEFQYFNNPVAL
ncbi:MAG: VOC family protein [candidate division WOR-3 bacterium]|nr:MAG: VOC family protein [candidate division WOR-3 bacterium]